MVAPSRRSRRRRLIGVALALAVAAVGMHEALSFGGAATAAGPRVTMAEGAALPQLEDRGDGHVTVAKPGVITLVDLRGETGRRQVSLYLTNLDALRRGYSTVLLRLVVRQSTATRVGRARPVIASTFLSDATGKATLQLPSGGVYTIALVRGGSLVVAPEARPVAPRFFATLA